MSFVVDRVRSLDGAFDRLHLAIAAQLGLLDVQDDRGIIQTKSTQSMSPRSKHLQALSNSLTSSNTQNTSLTTSKTLVQTLSSVQPTREAGFEQSRPAGEQGYEAELEWLVIGKIAAHTYGLVLEAYLKHTIPLSDELWYWDQTLNSNRYLGIYSVQSSPLRFWKWFLEVYHEIHNRRNSINGGWSQFYSLVKSTVRDKSIVELRSRVVNPVVQLRAEVQHKMHVLTHFRTSTASAIGLLMSHGFQDDVLRKPMTMTSNVQEHPDLTSWKQAIAGTVQQMSSVLQASTPRSDIDLNDQGLDGTTPSHMPISDVVRELEKILDDHLPSYHEYSRIAIMEHGRPGWLIRYWLPTVVLLLSSTTILRILVNRRAALLQWTREFGFTVIDFWKNWVVEPTKKVIGTIRHDEKSEVSIMSRASLEGDRASLERMVVDFAIDNPVGSALDDGEISSIRSKIRQGDLTPVLRVYEQELQSPLYGTLRGSLVRALLIQVQKTKVDVEIAMGGIDSLLKSQELVFGFVGLTPGLLVCAGLYRWIGNLSGQRKQSESGRRQSHTYQILRNIDRVLTNAKAQSDSLSFQEYGELVCEAISLRQRAQQAFPKNMFREFSRDFYALIEHDAGILRQIRIADRIRWAYAQWL